MTPIQAENLIELVKQQCRHLGGWIAATHTGPSSLILEAAARKVASERATENYLKELVNDDSDRRTPATAIILNRPAEVEPAISRGIEVATPVERGPAVPAVLRYHPIPAGADGDTL